LATKRKHEEELMKTNHFLSFRIKRFQGQQELSLSAEAELSSTVSSILKSFPFSFFFFFSLFLELILSFFRYLDGEEGLASPSHLFGFPDPDVPRLRPPGPLPQGV